MRTRKTVWAVVAVPTCLAATRGALAQPFTQQKLQLAAGGDYGLYLGGASEDIPSPYGLGVGASAGYTLGAKAYLGAESNYFFGASRRFPEYGDVEGSLRVLHYGAEIGLDLGLTDSLVLRPKLGLGAARVTALIRVEGRSGDVSETGLALTAGAELLHAWDAVFLGAETRYTSVSVDTTALRKIPGVEVEDGERLAGLLFCVRAGVAF